MKLLNLLAFAAFAVVCAMPSSASAQRDYFTAEEIEMIRDTQQLDNRMKLLTKIIDRRFAALGTQSGGEPIAAKERLEIVLPHQQRRISIDGLPQALLGAAVTRRAKFGVGPAKANQRIVRRHLLGGAILVDRIAEIARLHRLLSALQQIVQPLRQLDKPGLVVDRQYGSRHFNLPCFEKCHASALGTRNARESLKHIRGT